MLSYSQQNLFSWKQFSVLFNADVSNEPNTLQKFKFLKNQLSAALLGDFHSPVHRCLIKHGTGTGKTIIALLCAKSYIAAGKKVVIVGQNKQRFYSDAVLKPALGFVDDETAKQYSVLIQQQVQGQISSKEIKKKIKILLKDKIGFELMGYRKFASTVTGLKKDQVLPQINVDFLRSLDGGAIIVDEVHNVYNSDQRNQWGDALLIASLFLQLNTKLILMSGTPINNSLEIYDLANLLYSGSMDYIRDMELYCQQQWSLLKGKDNGADHSKYIQQLFKTSLFPSRDIPITTEHLRQAFEGKVSFFPQGLVAQDIPQLIIKGQAVLQDSQLKVHVVKPSTLEKRLLDSGLTRKDVRDISFFDFPFTLNSRPNELINVFKASSGERREITENGIDIIPFNGRSYLSGNVLLADEVKNFSGKLSYLLHLLTTTSGKVIIYHNDVTGTGILTIAELLKQNGFLTEDGQQMPDSICYRCGKKLITHKQDSDHVPRVTRFALLYGEQKRDLSQRILNVFNSSDNIQGQNIRIIIGSVFIRESVDFKEIRHLIVMQQPYNIPQLQQIIGRGVRQESHLRLLEKERNIEVHVLCSPLHEIEDYRMKLSDYQKVMFYDKIINELAIDQALYFIGPEDRAHQGEKKKIVLPSLGIESLPFEITIDMPESVVRSGPDVDVDVEAGAGAGAGAGARARTRSKINDTYYNAYQYYRQELFTLSLILDVAFQRSLVWDYTELKNFVFSYNTTPNPKLFSEHNLLMMIKRNQYRIVNGVVLPNGNNDINSIFTKGEPTIQTFKINLNDVLCSEISDAIEANLNAVVHDVNDINYLRVLQKFYNNSKSKELHIQLIKYFIEKDHYHELLLRVYGNFVYFTGVSGVPVRKDGSKITFPGKGLIHDHNIKLESINGFAYSGIIYELNQHKWIPSAFNAFKEYKIPRVHEFIHSSPLIGFHSEKMDFRFYDPKDAATVVSTDKRLQKRGKLCSSNSERRNFYYITLREVLLKLFNQEIYNNLVNNKILSGKVSEFSCETIQLILMFFQINQQFISKGTNPFNWFMLLDDVVDISTDKSGITTSKTLQKRKRGGYVDVDVADDVDDTSDDAPGLLSLIINDGEQQEDDEGSLNHV